MNSPILIIGQGLAGTALAWRLHERRLPFVIVDRDEPSTASKIAAGLVTPITGMRLNLSWRFDTLYPHALAFYRRREKQLGARFYHPVPLVRLLRDAEAAALWERRLRQPEIRRFVRFPTPQPLLDDTVFANPHGGFQQKHAGWLDTAAYLAASRAFFQAHGHWQSGEITPEHLTSAKGARTLLSAPETAPPPPILWQNRPFAAAIFCTGWEAAKLSWFSWVPFQSARGTVLTLHADTRGERRIISRGTWLLPRDDATLRAGPTYEWDFADATTPSPAAIAGLENNLHKLLRIPFHITATQTAVRPIIKGREALLGRHPAHSQIAFLNGLGSKGVLRAPWLAEHLIAHLLDGQPLEPDLDLAGNF